MVTGPDAPGNRQQRLLSAGLAGTYTFDLWGLSQDKLRAARESLRASRYAEQLSA